MSSPFRVAIVSPHRDDAAFSCGLLIAALLCAGAQVTVLNIFTVSSYTVVPERFHRLTYDEVVSAVSEQRRREDEDFARKARAAGQGSLHLHDLAWKDAPLRLDIPTHQVVALPLAEEEWKRQATQLSQEIAFITEQDAVFAPLGLGGHVDHGIARDAAMLVVDPGKLGLYEDLPYAARMSAEEWRRQTAAALDRCRHIDFGRQTVRLPHGSHLKSKFASSYPSQVAGSVVQEITAYSQALQDAERWFGGKAMADCLRKVVSGIATVTREAAGE